MNVKQMFQFLKDGIRENENHLKTYKSGFINGFSGGLMVGSFVMGVCLTIAFAILIQGMIP